MCLRECASWSFFLQPPPLALVAVWINMLYRADLQNFRGSYSDTSTLARRLCLVNSTPSYPPVRLSAAALPCLLANSQAVHSLPVNLRGRGLGGPRKTRQAYEPLTTVIYHNFIILILYAGWAKPISQGNATRSYISILQCSSRCF